MVITDVVVATSAFLVLGVIFLTTKFSREVPVNQIFDELWFEKHGQDTPIQDTSTNNIYPK